MRRAYALGDFTAFYCGATLVRQGIDPYRAAPLEACERARVFAPARIEVPAGDLEPAPLPGYVLATFVPLSELPFAAAATLWYALLIAAVIATVEVLRSLTELPRWAIAAALLGTDIVSSVTYGQLAPLATLGIAAAALLLTRRRAQPAALAAALTLGQPQIGVAVVASLLIWVPRARLAVLAVAAVAALVSVAALGIAPNVEYLRDVLPAQALAEAPFRIQLSLTWLLFFFGADEAHALRIASVEYALLLVAGVLAGRRIATAWELPAALVVVPAAAVQLGGTYLHVFQLAAALPCALLLAARVPRARVPAWIAVGLLAVPWQGLTSHAVLALSVAAAAAVAWAALARSPIAVRTAVAAAAILFVLAEPHAVARSSVAIVRSAPPVSSFVGAGFDPGLAPAQHGIALRMQPRRVEASARTFTEKLPFWVAMLLLLAALAVAAAPPPRGLSLSARSA